MRIVFLSVGLPRHEPVNFSTLDRIFSRFGLRSACGALKSLPQILGGWWALLGTAAMPCDPRLPVLPTFDHLVHYCVPIARSARSVSARLKF